MSSDHSTVSSSDRSEPLLLKRVAHGTHKVKYNRNTDWDFHLEGRHSPIDLSLILPHYRARHQPVDHRMSMLVAGKAESIKLQVCRPFPRCKFSLSVYAETSNVTVWLPSDFKGRLRYKRSYKTSFSAGFVNEILQNVRLNEAVLDDEDRSLEDEVVVSTHGKITFRMWDVQRCSPESTHKEALKRLFGFSRKAPEAAIDWDCLLKD